jgi:hypothetical protein
MKNPVMNYNQFMSAFKNSSKGYNGKGNTANSDAKTDSKVGQDLATGPIGGKGTPHIDRFTKQHLSNVKKKSAKKGK